MFWQHYLENKPTFPSCIPKQVYAAILESSKNNIFFIVPKLILFDPSNFLGMVSIRLQMSDESKDCGIRLSHIFEIASISNKKPSISIKIPCILIGNLEFRSKYDLFQIRNFEILGFSHLEFETLSISSEIPSISKTWISTK